MDFHHVIEWVAYSCLAGATFGCLYTAFAAFAVLRFGRGKTHAPGKPVPVTVLMPLCGHEPGLEARLRALATQDYGAPVQILCALHGADDPAIAVLQKVAADLPQADPRLHGRNLKMSNLMNVLPRARHDVLLMIDSDILVRPDHVSRIVGELQRGKAGAVTCLYTGVAEGGLWTRLSAECTNMQFLPSVIVGLITRLAEPCFGATIALTRATFERIGGLKPFVDHLWDDYAIGQAVRAAGLDVAVAPLTVGHVCWEGTAREFFDYQLRFARTVASIDPLGNFGAVITYPLALALIALLLGAGAPALAIGALALASRLALCGAINRRFGLGSPYWLLPLHDLAAFAVYVVGFFGGTVMWRGQRYRVHADGTLLQAPSQGS